MTESAVQPHQAVCVEHQRCRHSNGILVRLPVELQEGSPAGWLVAEFMPEDLSSFNHVSVRPFGCCRCIRARIWLSEFRRYSLCGGGSGSGMGWSSVCVPNNSSLQGATGLVQAEQAAEKEAQRKTAEERSSTWGSWLSVGEVWA